MLVLEPSSAERRQKRLRRRSRSRRSRAGGWAGGRAGLAGQVAADDDLLWLEAFFEREDSDGDGASGGVSDFI